MKVKLEVAAVGIEGEGERLPECEVLSAWRIPRVVRGGETKGRDQYTEEGGIYVRGGKVVKCKGYGM